jgi:starvation-inducible DNA-binding protein
MQIDIGIPADQREKIADGLARVLADTYTLYLKTHHFHWNVEGPMFQQLHALFQTHYNELWLAVDDVAERIRTLGFFAPGSYGAFAKLTRIPDTEGTPAAMDMVRILKDGHETVVRTIREVLPLAQAAGDESTASLLSDRMVVHEKTAWMLRAHLAG